MHDKWIACIVVLLSFFPTFSCSKDKACFKDRKLAIQKVMSGVDNASINCSSLEVNQERAQIMLSKGTELHFQNTQVSNTSMEKQRFSIHVKNYTVNYVIDMPQVNDTGLYNCTVAQHGSAVKTTLTFLLVTDSGLQSCLTEGQSASWLLLAAGCGLLALYNLITTLVSFSFAWKLTHQDTYQNDYYNTRPREFSRDK